MSFRKASKALPLSKWSQIVFQRDCREAKMLPYQPKTSLNPQTSAIHRLQSYISALFCPKKRMEPQKTLSHVRTSQTRAANEKKIQISTQQTDPNRSSARGYAGSHKLYYVSINLCKLCSAFMFFDTHSLAQCIA